VRLGYLPRGGPVRPKILDFQPVVSTYPSLCFWDVTTNNLVPPVCQLKSIYVKLEGSRRFSKVLFESNRFLCSGNSGRLMVRRAGRHRIGYLLQHFFGILTQTFFLPYRVDFVQRVA
jgi:hypothetical protein